MLASLSSFALEIAWLIALVLSVAAWSSSERSESLAAWRTIICLELFSFKLLNSFTIASLSSFILALVWVDLSLSTLNLSKTTRNVFIFSLRIFFSFMFASLSSFALKLAWLVAFIALALSRLIMFNSERREAVVFWRSLICLEFLSFKFLSFFALASLSSFALELAWLVALTALALSSLIRFNSERREAVVVLRSLISLELFCFKLRNSLRVASLSSFALALVWLVASILFALSDLILFSSERRETVVICRSWIFLLLLVTDIWNSSLARFLSSIALILSDFNLFNSDRKYVVILRRSLISAELFSFSSLNSLMLARFFSLILGVSLIWSFLDLICFKISCWEILTPESTIFLV